MKKISTITCKYLKIRPVILIVGFVNFLGIFCSCCSYISTDDGENFFNNIQDFHYKFFSKGVDAIKSNNLSLFVDYSTCNVLGQNSAFYQALVPSWVDATKHFYSIKGDSIASEEGPVFDLLRTINEVNYADLKGAIERMANSDSESVLLTDGEYYQKSIAQGNINNPYMSNALKTWLKKGHDIFVFTVT